MNVFYQIDFDKIAIQCEHELKYGWYNIKGKPIIPTVDHCPHYFIGGVCAKCKEFYKLLEIREMEKQGKKLTII